MNKDVINSIMYEVYKAVEHLGGKSDILSVLGSFGDTLEDSEVLECLKDWNKAFPEPNGYLEKIICQVEDSRCFYADFSDGTQSMQGSVRREN